MTVDWSDLLIALGVALLMAGLWLAAGWPEVMAAAGLILLAAGLIRAANRPRGER